MDTTGTEYIKLPTAGCFVQYYSCTQ